MAVYATTDVTFVQATAITTLTAAIEAHIKTLDKTTHPVLGVFQYGAGVLVVAGA